MKNLLLLTMVAFLGTLYPLASKACDATTTQWVLCQPGKCRLGQLNDPNTETAAIKAAQTADSCLGVNIIVHDRTNNPGGYTERERTLTIINLPVNGPEDLAYGDLEIYDEQTFHAPPMPGGLSPFWQAGFNPDLFQRCSFPCF